MLRTTLLAVGILVLGACKATPTLDGVPLTCSTDDTCPEGMRCFTGGCIENSPPHIDPPGLRFVEPGTELSATAVVTDAENDAVTITWTQLYDTGLLAEPHAGDTLTVTPDVQGTYVFEVIASDGYHASTAYLTLVAIDGEPPADGSVYVSDIGTDSEGCGTPSAPCATLKQGLTLGGTIVLAATQRSTAYDRCLALTANESIWGGFDANTWRYDPVLIARTEITCTTDQLDLVDPFVAATGHELHGTSVVGHVTLRLVAKATSWPDRSFVTVDLTNSQTLWGADVLAPAVPSPATSVGVLSGATNGRLLGVDVRGDPGITLDPPSYWLGIGAVDGELEVAALQGRGRVLLNAPTMVGAVGVENTGAEMTVSDIEIRGGVAAALLGLVSYGGNTTIEDSTIELRSFGTFHLTGISSDPLCDDLDCANPTQAALTATNNNIRLHGAVNSIVATCIGIGLQHRSAGTTAPESTTITGNTIELDGDIGLALGMGALGGGANITDNTVIISQSLMSLAGCPEYVRVIYPKSPTNQGAVGAILGGATGDTLAHNTITVEPRAGDSFGIYASEVDGASISDNVVTVAVAPPAGVPGDAKLLQPAVAALLLNEDPEIGPSTFEQNELRVGSHAGQGIALRMRGVVGWHVVNNTLYGGDTNYNTGLRIDPSTADAAWPKVAHNTIFGGTGLVSSAVRIDAEPNMDVTGQAPAGPVGVFVNNILDAGDGSGRRFVFDNRQRGVGGALGHALANVAQVAGTARPEPRATAALFTSQVGAQTGQLHLALPESGTFASLKVRPGTNAVEVSLEGWVPVGYAFNTIWVGNSDVTTVGPLAITGGPGMLSISRLGETTFDNFVPFPLTDSSGAPITPKLIILGEATAGPPLDVVFATDTHLWVAAGHGIAGEGIAFLARARDENGHVTMTDPGFLEFTFSDPDYPGINRFYLVDEADTDPRLVVWPSFATSDAIALPEAVTSFVAGDILATNASGELELQPLVAAVDFDGPVFEHVVYLTAPDGSMDPQPIDLNACQGDFVTTVEILRMCAGWCNDLWVGCQDGRVEGYVLTNTGSWSLTQLVQFAPSSLPVAYLSSYNNYIIVGYVGSPEVTVIPPPVPTRSPVSFNLLGDVGLRVGPEHLYRDTSRLNGLGADLGSCNLALRADPPVPHDLSLAAGPDHCDNTGTPLDDDTVDPYPDISVTVDFEGDPRAVAQPDVGADER